MGRVTVFIRRLYILFMEGKSVVVNSIALVVVAGIGRRLMPLKQRLMVCIFLAQLILQGAQRGTMGEA